MFSPNRFCLQGIPPSFAAANCRFCSNSASILGKFRRLHETTDNLIKMRILFEDFVRSTHLKNFRREPISLLDGWIEIQNQNESDLNNKISTPEGRKNEEDYLQKTMYLSQVALTNAAYYLARENLPDKLNKDSNIVTNASELRWMKSEDEKGNCLVSLPFTSANPGTNDPLRVLYELTKLDKPKEASKEETLALLQSERDAAIAMMLIRPLMNKDGVLFHEVGCWNGNNAINTLVYCIALGILPKYVLGTDINPTALGLAKMSFAYFDFPFQSDFYAANAKERYHLSTRYPDTQRIIQLALRVLPVMDFKGADTFFSVAENELRDKDSYLIVSYALPEGYHFDKLIKQVDKANGRRFEEFEDRKSGTLFDRESNGEERVVNTFYSEEQFRLLAKKHEFKVLKTIRAEGLNGEVRNVCVLRHLKLVCSNL